MILVQADTKPQLVRLLRLDGEPVPGLDSADHIEWKLRKPSGADLTKTATISDADVGRVVVNLGVGDLDETGWHDEELIIWWTPTAAQHAVQPTRIYVRAEYEVAP